MKRFATIISMLIAFALQAAAEADRVNPTVSPDGTRTAYTDASNNLFVVDNASGDVLQLTSDGGELILNGYSSWVYYEEIFGRPTKYKSFWWSPDSKKIAFCRFDNSNVPMFPIYSAKGQYGSISRTRYPKAGDCNPSVKIGIISLDEPQKTVWADFDEAEDQYFGTPFWGDDSQRLFVQRMPRVQQHLDLFAVSVADGSLTSIYSEDYPTWVNWMEDMLFSTKGLYMVRDFETGWQQIYFLSYDGKTFKRLTSGTNWRVALVAVNEKNGDVYFTAHRDSDVRSAFYKVDRKGNIKTLTDPSYNAAGVEISKDFKTFEATLSDMNTPARRYSFKTGKITGTPVGEPAEAAEDRPHMNLIYLTLSCGLQVPATITYPKGFDETKQYPVVMEIYGGPDTPYVRDSWRAPSERQLWYYNNGVIKVVADSRAAGHNGRQGVDLIYRDLTSVPVADFCEWAQYLQSLPYVDPSRIGVEGYSFGGTMTSMLVMNHPDLFRCGIAGGGVYDWTLYDTHYTERYMDTPQRNPEGYKVARALEYVGNYDPSKSYLKLTHGTGDDNVHFQNGLQMIDALQMAGKQFDLMIYPDGLHGYRGLQGAHDREADKVFWIRNLNINNN